MEKEHTEYTNHTKQARHAKYTNPVWKKAVLICVGMVVLFVAGFVGYLTITEYKPEDTEEVSVIGEAKRKIDISEEITVVTYNIGYGCDGEESDFFMDGGEMVRPESGEIVEKNMNGIIDTLEDINADVVYLQEIDRVSKRAYGINEVEMMADYFADTANYAFALNYYCKYVPYPIPETIGKVESGLMTFNEYEVTEAKRYNLPCSYSWPIRLGQLKRGLLVERAAIEGSDKEVVFINLHLEAYADGEKKTAQTKVLVDLIQQEYEKGNYVIAGGDFNQHFPGYDTEEIYPLVNTEYYEPETIDGTMLSSEWSWAADLSDPTCRLLNEPYDPESENTQYYVIDGFILSPNVKVEEIKTVDTKFAYSDHNPVVIKLSLE